MFLISNIFVYYICLLGIKPPQELTDSLLFMFTSLLNIFQICHFRCVSGWLTGTIRANKACHRGSSVSDMDSKPPTHEVLLVIYFEKITNVVHCSILLYMDYIHIIFNLI